MNAHIALFIQIYILYHSAFYNIFTYCTVALHTWSALVKLVLLLKQVTIVDTLMGAVPELFHTQNKTVILKEGQ